jgi:hypothetical protein
MATPDKSLPSHDYPIAILLPTRGRTDPLKKSIFSLIDLASDPTLIEILVGFDSDDEIGKNFFQFEIAPELDEVGVKYTSLEFTPMGYENLNLYYNGLAKNSNSDWLFAWNDDAIMQTQNWDQEITRYTGKFCLLKVRTHRDHPYSIFPIWPRAWYDIFGFASRHQMIDAELSQNAYMLDIMQKIPVDVVHDRHDLTGNNLDDTQKKKKTLEGNPADPKDFHNPIQANLRISDCLTIAKYLESLGHDLSFWKNVMAGKQDPWQKLKENDVNGLTFVKQIQKK